MFHSSGKELLIRRVSVSQTRLLSNGGFRIRVSIVVCKAVLGAF